MRQPGTLTLCCQLTPLEQDFFKEIMRMTGVKTQANVVRLGLYHLARHLDVPIGNQVFAQKQKTRRRQQRERVAS